MEDRKREASQQHEDGSPSLLLFGRVLDLLYVEACVDGERTIADEKKSAADERGRLTGGKRLLELGGFLRVVEREGVEVARAADLELGLGLATRNPRSNLLYARRCRDGGKEG